MNENDNVAHDHGRTTPLSHYSPDFLSSLYILAKSIEGPHEITFTSQYVNKTKNIYDLLGEGTQDSFTDGWVEEGMSLTINGD